MALYGNLFYTLLTYIILSQVALVVKNCLPMQETRDAGLIPGSGRYPGEGNGKQLQYCCLENPLDRDAWWARVHRVTKGWTQLQ